MKIFIFIAQWITRVNYLIASIVAGVVFLMAAVISIDVVCRYFFNAPTVWAMELATLLFGPYFMLSGAYVLHVGGHVNVDVLYEHFSAKLKRWVDCAIYVIICCICVMFIMISWPLALEALQGGETTFSSWNPPVWPIKMVIPLTLLLVALQAMAEIFFIFCDVDKKHQDKGKTKKVSI